MRHASQLNFHLNQYLPNSRQQSLHICRKNAPDAANTETIGFADFTWIDDIFPLVQRLIELFEIEVGVIGVGEGCNNEALIFGGDVL